ncbi:hypothetical protein GEMRC1_010021 [Eukaryota sp. GEM-RC1]
MPCITSVLPNITVVVSNVSDFIRHDLNNSFVFDVPIDIYFSNTHIVNVTVNCSQDVSVFSSFFQLQENTYLNLTLSVNKTVVVDGYCTVSVVPHMIPLCCESDCSIERVVTLPRCTSLPHWPVPQPKTSFHHSVSSSVRLFYKEYQYFGLSFFLKNIGITDEAQIHSRCIFLNIFDMNSRYFLQFTNSSESISIPTNNSLHSTSFALTFPSLLDGSHVLCELILISNFYLKHSSFSDCLDTSYSNSYVMVDRTFPCLTDIFDIPVVDLHLLDPDQLNVFSVLALIKHTIQKNSKIQN